MPVDIRSFAQKERSDVIEERKDHVEDEREGEDAAPIPVEVDPADDGKDSSQPEVRSKPFTDTMRIGEQYDVLDSTNRWCEGEVMKIDRDAQRVFVSYLYWDRRYDEWITDIPSRIAGLHEHTYTDGRVLRVGQRVEALDEKQQWREAFIVDENPSQVKVHYKGFHVKFDEWIRRSAPRFLPFGRNKFVADRHKVLWGPGQRCKERRDVTPGRDNSNNRPAVRYIEEERRRKIETCSEQFLQYTKGLEARGLLVVSVSGDGNCLFRSVSHQVYGDECHHAIVRARCMDYMESEADFFSQFIIGGRAMFAAYLRAKRMDACWGDDPEIQALCELYNRPAEIWAFEPSCGAKMLRTFHETSSSMSSSSSSTSTSMRLSYYGGGHYDSIIDGHHAEHLLTRKPGEVEELRINASRNRFILASSRGGSAGNDVAAVRAMSDLEATEAMTLEAALQESRRLHKNREYDDLETCLAHSLQGYKENEEQLIEQAMISSLDPTATEEVMVAEALKASESELVQDEEVQKAIELSALSEAEALELALQESMRCTSSTSSSSSAAPAVMAPPVRPSSAVDEEEELRRAIAMSLGGAAAASSSSSSGGNHQMEYDMSADYDMDEDLMRAIQESLSK